MYRCVACKVAFVHPVPSDAKLAEFYSTFHKGDDEGGVYDAMEGRMQADFPAKVGLVKAALARLGGAGGGAGRVLDVGCGKGYFVKAACDAGIDAEGIDLSDTGVRFATEELKVRACVGRIDTCAEEFVRDRGMFDVVTFWATIEHVPDPVATLSAIRRVLRPGGMLLLDTGIGWDWLDRSLPGRVQWYDPPQHLYVFSEASMRHALQASGFTTVSFDGCFERSPVRRLIRRARAAVLATGLRVGAALGRMKHGPFVQTKYPIGNLMSVSARRD